jgi:hypothetical protein
MKGQARGFKVCHPRTSLGTGWRGLDRYKGWKARMTVGLLTEGEEEAPGGYGS